MDCMCIFVPYYRLKAPGQGKVEMRTLEILTVITTLSKTAVLCSVDPCHPGEMGVDECIWSPVWQ